MADENTTQPVEISEIEAKDIAGWIISAGAEWETQLSNQLSEAYGAAKGSAIFDVVKKIKVGALTTGLAWDSSKTVDQNVVNIAGGSLPYLVGTGVSILGGFGTVFALASGIALDAGLKSMGINTGDIVESLYNYTVEHISASSADGIDFHLEVTAQNYLNNESSLVQTLKDMDSTTSVTLNFADNVSLTYNPVTDTVEMKTSSVENLVNVNEYLQNSVFANSTIKSDMVDYTVINNDLQNKSMDFVKNLEQNIYNNYLDNLIDNITYQDISKNFSNYYLQSLPSYTPMVDYYFNNINPIDIGAFYESTTNQEDNSTSIADKTFVLLDSSNGSITKEELETLDINQDGKLDETEITTLKTWKDINEDGIAQKVSLIKSKNTIIFYQANFKRVA